MRRRIGGHTSALQEYDVHSSWLLPRTINPVLEIFGSLSTEQEDETEGEVGCWKSRDNEENHDF